MRRIALLLALVSPLAAGGCSTWIDREQLDLCRRVLPALHPDGTELREIRFAPERAGDRGGIRIDYAAREPAAETRIRYAVCRFGNPDRGERLDLSALVTDTGSLGEARLLFLKRFWLGRPDIASDVAPPTPAVTEVRRGLAYAAQQGINAIVLAAIYGLLATAYSLIYGLVGRIILSFGEIAVVGAYGVIGGVAAALTFGVSNPFGGFALALMLAVSLSGLWSWFVGKSVIAPLHAGNRLGQPILVATIAVALSIQEFLRLFQGVREQWLPPLPLEPVALARSGSFVVTVSPVQIWIGTAAVAATLGLLAVMRCTSLGRQWRAFADDPVAARLFGVSPARILSATFVLAGLSAGLAGWVIAIYYGNVSFSMGTILGLKALLAAIIGGIGRIEGALLGGILIGLVETAWSAYFSIDMRDIVVFSILIVMFVLRPGGLLGISGPQVRDV
ncbi:MAG: branched-chain amino acid ABC transporter permease [Pseudorhodoplanes sp.]|nr:branched-chain amino acid ABC transporter permease [Pseudorhodoplanes sp.]